jgi:hypothetical protein
MSKPPASGAGFRQVDNQQKGAYFPKARYTPKLQGRKAQRGPKPIWKKICEAIRKGSGTGLVPIQNRSRTDPEPIEEKQQ